jgi:hypothetical protein
LTLFYERKKEAIIIETSRESGTEKENNSERTKARPRTDRRLIEAGSHDDSEAFEHLGQFEGRSSFVT